MDDDLRITQSSMDSYLARMAGLEWPERYHGGQVRMMAQGDPERGYAGAALVHWDDHSTNLLTLPCAHHHRQQDQARTCAKSRWNARIAEELAVGAQAHA